MNVPKMPKAMSLQTPAPAPLERIYKKEVLDHLQQFADTKEMVAQLEAERDEWRRKAIAAQDDCRRLEARIETDDRAHEQMVAKLTEDRDRKIEELTARRDDYKLQLARLKTKIGLQGKAVMDLARSVSATILETMNELKDEQGEQDTAGAVGLAAIADAIGEDEQPLPRMFATSPPSS
jgi:predicted RNase H-like nuclease (RuvC/YqgF family)